MYQYCLVLSYRVKSLSFMYDFHKIVWHMILDSEGEVYRLSALRFFNKAKS